MVNVTAVAGARNVLLKAFGSLSDISIVDSFVLLLLLLFIFHRGHDQPISSYILS